MPKDIEDIREDLDRSGRPSADDESTGVAGILRKGVGGYGADDESVDRQASKEPLTDPSGHERTNSQEEEKRDAP